MVWNPLSFLGGGIAKGVSGVIDSGAGLARVFVGDKGQRDQGYHDESMASRNQFATEFQVTNRTWFDSLIDGLNRLPRPAMVAMILAYINLSWVDPIQFNIVNQGLDLVPDRMWDIVLLIVSFYFVAREIQKSREKKLALSKADFDEHMRRVKELRDLKAPADTRIGEAEFQAEVKDATKPMSNAAIEEWNRRRKGA